MLNQRGVYVWRLARIVLVLALLASFALGAWGRLLENTNSNKGDDAANLMIGLDIREGRALTDGNRQPLFPLLLAPWAQRSWSYYTAAKLVSLACALATLLAALLLTRSRRGWAVALTLLALLSLNGRLAHHTPRVLCEGLLTGLSFAAWLAGTDALRRPASWRNGVLAGAMLGLVYLTKGTGSIMFGAYLLAGVLIHRRRAFGLPVIWGSLAAFVGIASPLLFYNWRRYGQPFYNYNSAHAMWFDAWSDAYLSKIPLPTMSGYLATHSLGQVLQRQLAGMVSVWTSIAEAFDLVGLDGIGWIFVPVFVGIVILGAKEAMQGDVRRRTSADLILAAVFLLAIYLLFAWYQPVSSAPRFFLPIVPMVYLLAARFVESVLKQIRLRLPGHEGRGWSLAATALGLLLLVWPLSHSVVGARELWPPANPFTSDAQAGRQVDPVIEQLNFMAAQQPAKPLRLLWGPSHTILAVWRLDPDITQSRLPGDLVSWDDLDQYLLESEIDVVVLDDEMFKNRRDLLEVRIDKSKHQLLWHDRPTNWTYVMAQRSEETIWFLYRVNQASDPNRTPVAGRFGSVVALEGYDVALAVTDQKLRAEVDLIWRALTPPDRDWTVFVHLLDAAGNRVAQVDSYPLGGMYPTRRWQAGQAVRDHYVLCSDGPIAPGAYTLMAGFYDYRDGSRLPATGESIDIDGKAVLLPAGVPELADPAGQDDKG